MRRLANLDRRRFVRKSGGFQCGVQLFHRIGSPSISSNMAIFLQKLWVKRRPSRVDRLERFLLLSGPNAIPLFVIPAKAGRTKRGGTSESLSRKRGKTIDLLPHSPEHRTIQRLLHKTHGFLPFQQNARFPSNRKKSPGREKPRPGENPDTRSQTS